MNVYVNRNGSVEGPFDIAELKTLVEAGELTGNEDVCPEGDDTWVPLSSAFLHCPSVSTKRPPTGASRVAAKGRREGGCRTGCVTLLLVFAMLCIILVFSFNRIVWHSSIPYRVIAHLISSENPHITIEGISGSISEGASVQYFSYTDADGHTSFLEHAGFRHNPLKQMFSQKRFVLYNVEVKRGHLFVPSFKDTDSSEDGDTEEPESSGASQSEKTPGLKLFEIKTISIHNVVVEARDTGQTFELNTLTLDGLKIADGQFDMGELLVESNFIDLTVPPATSSIVNGKLEALDMSFKGHLKPDLIESLTKGIPFKGDFKFVNGKLNRGQLTACGGAVKILMAEAADGTGTMTAKANDWRINSYGPALMLDHVYGTLIVEGKFDEQGTDALAGKADGGAGSLKHPLPRTDESHKLIISDLSFDLGSVTFTGEPLNAVLTPDRKDPVVLVSRAVDGEICYTLKATLTPDQQNDSASLQLSLTSVPERSLRDCLSSLLYKNPYSDLEKDQRKRVEWYEKAFLKPLFTEQPANTQKDDSHQEEGL
jgi:hypothetical protein